MSNGRFHLALDKSCHAADILELRFLDLLAAGRPHGAFGVLKPAMPPTAVVPADATVLGTFQRHNGADLLAEGPDYVLFVESWASETLVTVGAASHERAAEVVADLTRVPHEADIEADIALWRAKPGGGGKRSGQSIPTESWDGIAENYPTAVRGQIAELMARQGVAAGEGRLIWFHGAPGTGKSTAIRALVHELRHWADAHVIADPERLFSDTEYLVNVLQSQEGRAAPTITDPAGPAQWKLLIAEDADAFLMSTAGHGQLLNSTDGLLGQTAKVLVLLTSNEELARLHPALIRPGRCLSRTEFVRFPPEEARSWLGDGVSLALGGATLAELFEARRTQRALTSPPVLTGAYL